MASAAASTSTAPQPISLTDLDLNQLVEVKNQLDEELTHLSNSFQQLRQAQAKFKACQENVQAINPQNKGATTLVPLTESLYVPGKLCDLENVIVDVGTGYYVKKTRAQATKHYQAKIDYIRANLETLQETITKKQDNMNYLTDVMQMKLQARAGAEEKGGG